MDSRRQGLNSFTQVQMRALPDSTSLPSFGRMRGPRPGDSNLPSRSQELVKDAYFKVIRDAGHRCVARSRAAGSVVRDWCRVGCRGCGGCAYYATLAPDTLTRPTKTTTLTRHHFRTESGTSHRAARTFWTTTVSFAVIQA